MQDPQWFRNEGSISRDGCRVPMPWTKTGSSFGFGPGGSHLPQPEWFGDWSVEAQDGVAGSTLELYRKALKLRKGLVAPETVSWVKHWLNPNVLHFVRPNGWTCITNFGTKPVKLPKGELLLTTADLVDGKLPANATAWLKA
jgi:alpha-glucosidase